MARRMPRTPAATLDHAELGREICPLHPGLRLCCAAQVLLGGKLLAQLAAWTPLRGQPDPVFLCPAVPGPLGPPHTCSPSLFTFT